MKKFMKLIPALAMLLIATTLVSTATFAWFSMNTSVSVTGMEIKAVVQDNLLIAKATNGIADNDGEAESSYKKALTDSIKAILEPASTVNGVTYYYTASDNVVGSGDARSDVYIPYATTGVSAGETGYVDKFSQNYGVSTTIAGNTITGETQAYAYKDYAFYIKATNTSDSNKNVTMTTLQLTYGANTTVAQKAFRVAVFTDAMTNATTGAHNSVADMTLVSIVKPASATNFTANSAVSDETTVSEIVSTKRDQPITIGEVAKGTTKYFKVVVRLWLEGEDNTCNNETFATLTDSWILDLVCKMDGTAGVSALTQVVPAAKTNLASATLSEDTKIIDNVTYTKIASVQIDSKDIYVLGTTLTSASRIFTLEDNLPFEVTNQCTLPTT